MVRNAFVIDASNSTYENDVSPPSGSLSTHPGVQPWRPSASALVHLVVCLTVLVRLCVCLFVWGEREEVYCLSCSSSLGRNSLTGCLPSRLLIGFVSALFASCTQASICYKSVMEMLQCIHSNLVVQSANVFGHMLSTAVLHSL